MPAWRLNLKKTKTDSNMTPAPIGTRIQVIANTNNHHYRIKGIYRVSRVDNDGTFKAVDENGNVGDYLRWSECRPVGLGWEWIREHLDARSLDLLSAFDGLEGLTLRSDVESGVITSIPNLANAILDIIPVVDQQRENLHKQDPDEDDLDIDGLFD